MNSGLSETLNTAVCPREYCNCRIDSSSGITACNFVFDGMAPNTQCHCDRTGTVARDGCVYFILRSSGSTGLDAKGSIYAISKDTQLIYIMDSAVVVVFCFCFSYLICICTTRIFSRAVFIGQEYIKAFLIIIFRHTLW